MTLNIIPVLIYLNTKIYLFYIINIKNQSQGNHYIQQQTLNIKKIRVRQMKTRWITITYRLCRIIP